MTHGNDISAATPYFLDIGTQVLYGEYRPEHRKYKIQDGGSQTGSTYISASRQDSNSVSTANPIFGIQQFNGAITNTVRCYRKLEIQDGWR